jgi:chromosome segregation ATPase
MAKWDLSKLPDGRKPLPDEWFRERAQMQERIEERQKHLQTMWGLWMKAETQNAEYLGRIEELEAKLVEYKMIAGAIDKRWAESEDEVAELQANLAKAVDAIDGLLAVLPDDEGPEIDYARNTIAELKGEADG